MAGDRYYINTTLLLPLTGSNNSIVFTDYSLTPKTLTKFGDTKIITTVTDSFGSNTGVAYFDGAGDYLQATASNLIGTGDFTVEFFAKYNTISPQIGLSIDNGSSAINFFTEIDDGGTVRAYLHNGTTVNGDVTSASGIITANTWCHVAITVYNGVMRVFVSGNLVSSITLSGSRVQNLTNLNIGRFYNGLRYLNGYLSNLRITNGVARYTTSFTPPTSQLENYSGKINYTLTEALTATQFRLITNKLSDGSFVRTDTITASGSLNMTLLDAVSLTAVPAQGNKWVAGTIYAAGDLVFPTSNPTHYFQRVAGTGGTSGSTEPTWVTTIGDTTTDDGVWNNCWECIALLADSISHSPVVPNDVSPPTVVFDFTGTKTYLHEAWSPDNNAFVYWTDTTINLSPTATQPSSIVANLTNKSVVRKNK